MSSTGKGIYCQRADIRLLIGRCLDFSMKSVLNKIHSGLKFIGHHCSAKRWDAFHSPNLYHLFSYACNEQIKFPFFRTIEEKRSLFLRSDKLIHRTDYGAGTTGKTRSDLSISDIAKSSLSLPFQCRFMARLTHYNGSNNIVELGTSLGITSAYLASSTSGKVITVEGDPIIAQTAEELFRSLGLSNAHVINARFEDFFTGKTVTIDPVDLLFIDGNHKADKVRFYFESFLSTYHQDTIVVVDDIHWSDDMYKGWKELIGHTAVTQSVDCFHFGLLFFNHSFLEKEHHTIRLPLKSLFK